MRIGMIGLGRMGANMARRLQRGGHDCVVHDVNADSVQALVDEGFTGAETLEELVAELEAPRCIWVMIPAAFVSSTLDDLVPLLDEDDTVIDGGNSWYHLDVDRAKELGPKGIHYVDVGTSGGIAGLERGYCLMIGGDDTAVGRLEPIFDTLAPGADAAPRTKGRTGDLAPEERGWLHCGPSGAGHFVKMVHNGIEYGLMSALGEGLNVLHQADIGLHDHPVAAVHLGRDLDAGAAHEESGRLAYGTAGEGAGVGVDLPLDGERDRAGLGDGGGGDEQEGEGGGAEHGAGRREPGLPADALPAACGRITAVSGWRGVTRPAPGTPVAGAR